MCSLLLYCTLQALPSSVLLTGEWGMVTDSKDH